MALAEIPARRLLLLGSRQGGGFVPQLNPDWWQRWQYKGANPTVVMDFANGIYYDGTQTSTDPTTFVSNGTVTAGSGLLCNATNITAKGALLSAFQGAGGFSAQISTFGAAASAGANVGILTDNNNNGLLNVSSGGWLLWNGSAGIQDSTGLDWTKTCWGVESISSNIRRLTSMGPGSTTGATGVKGSDTAGWGSPTTVYLGSWNNAFEFGTSGPPQAGFIAQLAVFNAVQLPDAIIPVPGFFPSQGLWWNGDATNFGATYGNVLQHEYTDPWTFIVGACVLTYPNAGPTGVTGIFFTNVPLASQNAGYPGYEFWVDGDGHMTVRIIHNIGTPAFIGVHGTTNVANGAYHVFAATYDGSGRAAGVKMYIDGVLETSTVESDTLGGGSIKDPNNTFIIGNQVGLAYGLPGAIGFVRQYNRQLSQAEIQNFNINKTIPPIDSSCVLAPKFSEGGTSTTTGDDSASALTGTLANSNYWLRI